MENQTHQGVLLCLNNDSRLKICTLCALNLLFNFRESQAIASRSENLRNELLMFNFFRNIKSIGSVGVTVTCYLTNSGEKFQWEMRALWKNATHQ